MVGDPDIQPSCWMTSDDSSAFVECDVIAGMVTEVAQE